MNEFSIKYCSCHPETKREIKDNGMEGLPLSGVECEFRKELPVMGYQSFCQYADRVLKGCEPNE